MKNFRPIQCELKFIMRVSIIKCILLLSINSMVSASEILGQNLLERRVTIDKQNTEIGRILADIEQQAIVKFNYSNAIPFRKRVSISVDSVDIKTVIELLFNSRVSPQIKGNEIILKLNNDQAKKNATVLFDGLNDDDQFSITISGIVIDENMQALPGVNVLEKGTTNGTTTDSAGKFVLPVENEGSILVFSFIGYSPQEIIVGKQNTLSIQLVPDIQSLQEVVVVGYGTQKKSDLTGSVSSVKSEQLTAFPSAGVIQALQGRAAGVTIQANNGDPGGTFKVRIRGGTSINAGSDPIYVVDGFVGATLPPAEDIESIEVLKDASATAIYGSRGANGVIMITTKKGKSGKARIELNSSYTSQSEINRIDLLNADEFLAYTQEVIPAYVSGGANMDWQDEIFTKGGIQNYQLSMSGGSDAINYYISGAYFDQKGIIRNSSFDRLSLTSNLNFKISNKLKAGLNLFVRRSGRTGQRTQEVSGGANEAGVVGSALRFMPDLPIYKPDGSYTTASIGDPIDNPYAIATELQNESIADLMQGNLFLNYEILKNLAFRTTLGVNTENERIGDFIPTTLNQGKNVGGDAQLRSSRNTNIINENYLTYVKTFNDLHNVTLMGGYSVQKTQNANFSARGQSFITNAVSFWNLGGASVTQLPSSAISETQIASYYARLNYSFNDKYLFTFNARYDGSSNFSKNNKWAFFPSGAFAWNMKNEKFMENINFITSLKWRASYGITGNQAIAPYQTLARFSNTFTVINGVAVNAVRPTAVANDDLTWETTEQMDIGLDLGVLDNRVNLTVDYYKMTTSDLLFGVPLPSYSGFTTQLQNIGKVENKGFEFTVSSINTIGSFKWNTDFNISANRNKVLELPGGNDILYGSNPGHLVGLGQTQILREGYPVGSFFGWIYDGVYQEGDTFTPGSGFEQAAGGEKFRDIGGEKDANGNLTGNPDGLLNSDDRTIIGNPQPKFSWGFNNDFQYRNFDLNIFFQGTQGNDILSYTLLELETLSGPINSTKRALDRWTPDNTSTDVPSRILTRPRRVTSRWVYDGSFVRLKNIALGYTVPQILLNKVGLERLRIYVSAQNIFTITNYKGFDPEVNYRSESGTDSNRNLGLDYGSYPNAKSYTVGLNIGL